MPKPKTDGTKPISSGGAGISNVRKRLGDPKPNPNLPAGSTGKNIPSGVTTKGGTTPKLDTLPKSPLGGKTPGTVAGDRSTPADVRGKLVGPKSIGSKTETIVPMKSKAQLQEMAKNRFPDRLKSGQLDTVVKTETGQKLKLGDQYKASQQGDVARRLQLQSNVKNITNVTNKTNVTNVKNITNVTNVTNVNLYHHADHYHGFVHPSYRHSAFEFHYYGPSFFAGVCWYPRWDPWVSWSWGYHCHPIWDPRPLWCRPIIYDPCPVWVYYPVPVWTPLPEVACGTWVDVRPVAVAPQQFDLQLLAVRFADPGHPEEKLGPRYRVWYRNNSPQAVTQPFNVVLLAGNGATLAQGLPQSGVRVTAVEAGDTQSVDIRLPWEVYAMNRDPQGQPAPYTTLHVLVDANREVPEVSRSDNGATIPVAQVLPIDPAAFEVDPVQSAPGGEVLLAGEGLGPEAGRVLVNVNGQELDGEILGWYDLGVRVRLPAVPLAAPTPAEVICIRGDGAAANPLKVTMVSGSASAPGLR